MKRSDLIREIQEMGCVLVRHGRKHERNPMKAKIAPPCSAPDTSSSGGHYEHTAYSRNRIQ